MKSIGFNNFRKFVEFPELKFNDITLMVGKNNSGKSTLVKAVLLVVDYLKNQQNQLFSFSTANVKDVNIISFDRARCRFQPDDVIYFNCFIAPHYNVNIKVSGDKRSISGNVEEVAIKDNNKNLLISINYSSNTVDVKKGKTIEHRVTDLEKEIEAILVKIKAKSAEVEFQNKQGKDISEIIKEIDSLNNEMKKLMNQQELSYKEKTSNVYSLSYQVNLDRSPFNGNFEDYIKEFLNENQNEKRLLVNQREKEEFTDELNEKLEEVNLVFESKSELEDSISELVKSINSHYFYYWSAETQKQSALFSIRDDNNALAMAIHDFCNLKIQRGNEEWIFIENQMQGFDIGERFELIPHASEAYECNIFDKSACFVSLADKGMGTIQIMTLLFRLATMIRQQKQHKENITLVIEEPELNLHPSLQSKLALLFDELNKNKECGLKFIVETHSEYLIRQSQALVNKQQYKDKDDLLNNNFTVYYFPTDNMPYEMQYRIDGKFSNEFGTGFFNEANKLIFEIL